MSIFTTFFKLSWKDQRLLFEALFVMIKVRLMLWVMSFYSIQKSFSKIEVSSKRDRTICELKWSIKIVSQQMPRSTCLTNALSGYILLSKHGYASLIKIGVGKSIDDEFEAHAWLEYDGNVIIGESEKGYVTLFDLGTS